MRYETFIALRYLRARRKQALVSVISLVSTLGFMVGVAALIIALALMTGFREDIQQRILSTSAHLIVQPLAGSGSMEDYRETLASMEAVEGVVAASPVILDKGLLLSAARSKGEAVILKAVLPEREARVTSLSESMEEGSSLKALEGEGFPPGIVLGHELALSLGVVAGDRVRLVSPNVTLSPLGVVPRTYSFEVVGTFSSGFYLYDTSWAYVHFETGQALWGQGDAAQMIEARVARPERVEEVQERLAGVLEPFLYLTNWKEMNRPLFSAFKVEKLLMFFAIGLIVVVASFNIITTLVLMVMEKHRDIGILKAMGARSQSISRIFTSQGFSVGALGTALGVVLGVGLCYVLHTYKLIPLSPEVYFIPYVPFHVKALDVAVVALAALGISLLATVYPAHQAARLEVIEALKHE